MVVVDYKQLQMPHTFRFHQILIRPLVILILRETSMKPPTSCTLTAVSERKLLISYNRTADQLNWGGAVKTNKKIPSIIPSGIIRDKKESYTWGKNNFTVDYKQMIRNCCAIHLHHTNYCRNVIFQSRRNKWTNTKLLAGCYDKDQLDCFDCGLICVVNTSFLLMYLVL